MEEMESKIKLIIQNADSWGSHMNEWRVLPLNYIPPSIKVFCDSSWKWSFDNGYGSAGWGTVVMHESIVMAINAGYIIDSPSSDHAEGMALLNGLSIGVTLNLPDACFLTDSMAVMRVIALGCGMSQPPLWLSPCLQLLNAHQGWKVDWIARDRNPVADYFSKKARRQIWSWSRVDAIPYDPSTPWNEESEIGF